MEEEDNGPDLYLYKISPRISERQCRITVDQREYQTWSVRELMHEKVNQTIDGLNLMSLKVMGKRELYADREELYGTYQEAEEAESELTFIPYFAWANRGENEMRVWVRT